MKFLQHRWAIIAILAAGIAVRVITLLLIADAPLISDADRYRWSAFHHYTGRSLFLYWPPGLPLYLSTIYDIFNDTSEILNRIAMLVFYPLARWLFRTTEASEQLLHALIVLMAQAGAFVPAERAEIGVVDRIFSRVGAGDDLAGGQSTFMVEMSETAAILHQASRHSLLILDEIGRGTATFDGLSLAWAIAEHVHDGLGCRTILATHYHELTLLAESLPYAVNRSLAAKEWKGDLVFLHSVRDGPADRSYGIEVAKIAGLPRAVTRRASEVLARLETERGAARHALLELPLFASGLTDETRADADPPEPEATTSSREDHVAAALARLNPDRMTPREALDALYGLKELFTATEEPGKEATPQDTIRA